MVAETLAWSDFQPGAAGLGAPCFALGELVVVGRAARVETAERMDPSATDRAGGTGGLLVHPAIMAAGVRP
jgi:hypothetical protein